MNLAKPGQNEKTLKTYLEIKEEEGMIKLLYKIYELIN
jgi:hypothetical protein